MWLRLLMPIFLFNNCFISVQQKDSAKSDLTSLPQIISFCELINSPRDSTKEFRVRAIYRVGFEWSELYSLKCQSDLRMWVEFSDDWKNQTKRSVQRELNKGEGTFGVILRGRLISGQSGHMGAYPLKFEVISAEGAKRLDKRSYYSGALTPDMRRKVEDFEAKP